MVKQLVQHCLNARECPGPFPISREGCPACSSAAEIMKQQSLTDRSFPDDIIRAAVAIALDGKERARMHAMRGYPYMQQFLNRSMAEDCCEALAAVEEKRPSREVCRN